MKQNGLLVAAFGGTLAVLLIAYLVVRDPKPFARLVEGVWQVEGGKQPAPKEVPAIHSADVASSSWPRMS